jgi:hypothetical protein
LNRVIIASYSSYYFSCKNVKNENLPSTDSSACLLNQPRPRRAGLLEWRRHSSFYFQPEPDVVFNDIHDGRGRGGFGAVFLLSQLGQFGSLFSSLYTRKARPQSLHSYSLPGIVSHLLDTVHCTTLCPTRPHLQSQGSTTDP